MSKQRVTLTNNFHNSSTVVIATVLNHGPHFEITLTRSQMDRSQRRLCGIAGCTCGGPAGIRGRQDIGGKTLIVNAFPA